MPPSLIESCVADIHDEVSSSSNSNDGRGSLLVSMTDSDLIREPRSCKDFGKQAPPSSSGPPRFTLRKRCVPEEQRGVVISSYNSDFLSGIFADIAKANTSEEEEDSQFDETLSRKKSRVSMTRSISRCARSYANLASVSPTPEESGRFDVMPRKTNHFKDQRHCVSSSSSEESSAFGGKLAFPRLSASISDSSCTSLTRKQLGQLSPEPETFAKDYGWFVQVDDDDESATPVDAYKTTSNTTSLAFIAPTAPKGVNHDAEVEWAKAADTVDDVLGDFF